MPSLEFANLPLIEVVIRLTISKPVPLDLAAAAQLHLALRDRLPIIEQPLEVEHTPGRPTLLELHPGRLLAAHYRDDASGLVIGVQPSLLFARWSASSRQGSSGTSYPHFPRMAETLWFAAASLRQVFGEARFEIANMSYTNFVKTSDASVSQFLDRYFLAGVRPAILEPSDTFHTLNISWRRSDETDLRLVIERGEIPRTPITAEDGYKILTVAGRRFPENVEPKTFVQSVHDHLQELFRSILSDHAKVEWGYAQK